MYRGDKHTFEFSNLPYDLTSEKITFVVKANYGSVYPRLIYKRNNVAGGDSSQIYVSYKKPYSKIYVTIKPNDTEDLVKNKYVFDIVRTSATDSTNTNTLFVGNLNLKNVVSTPWDGVDLSDSGRVFAVLSEGKYKNDFAVWDSAVGLWVRISVDSVIELLSIEAGVIPDSVLFPYETNQWDKIASDDVTLTDTQIITGQKEFSAGKTVFSGDTVQAKSLILYSTVTDVDYPEALQVRAGTIQIGSDGLNYNLYNSLIIGNTGEASAKGGYFNASDRSWLYNAGYKAIYSLNGLRTDGDIFIDAGQLISRDTVFVKTITIDSSYTFPRVDGMPNQILKTDGNGVVTWQDESGGSVVGGLFETDSNGDLMPNDVIAIDPYFETDSNGDIQPL